MAVSQQQIDKLNEHVTAGDRIGYYSQLAEYGYAYAALALGVVRADTLSGRTANAFLEDQAAEQGVTLSNGDLALLRRHGVAIAANSVSRSP